MEETKSNLKDNAVEVRSYNWKKDNSLTGYYEFDIYIIQFRSIRGRTIRIRFSEVEWLHSHILKEYLGCCIPHLPEKNLMANLWQNTSIAKQRVSEISQYLNYLVKHKYIGQSEVLRNFFDMIEQNKQEIQNKRSLMQSAKDYLWSSIK